MQFGVAWKRSRKLQQGQYGHHILKGWRHRQLESDETFSRCVQTLHQFPETLYYGMSFHDYRFLSSHQFVARFSMQPSLADRTTTLEGIESYFS